MAKPKILVIGYARHGKDTVCEYLRDHYEFSFVSSSLFCAERVVFPILFAKYGYQTAKECFEDRGNHRAEWYNAIREFNNGDEARLGREIWKTTDIYCGLRSADEFKAIRDERLFNICLWVDAGSRVPREDKSSCTVDPSMADYVIDNSSTPENLNFDIDELMGSLGIEKMAIRPS